MKKVLPCLILAVLLAAGPARAGELYLMTPRVARILDQAHLFKAQAEKDLWARYDLVTRDEDLFGLDREEAAALLLAAFERAPDRDKFESAWLNLKSVSGGETVFGKIHGRPGQKPVTDLSMFEINRSLLKASLNLKQGLVKELDSILSDMLHLFKEKLGQGPEPGKKRPSGEMEF